ncbi:zinc finger, CCHC-type containing protein [Tanacetum coccineum]
MIQDEIAKTIFNDSWDESPYVRRELGSLQRICEGARIPKSSCRIRLVLMKITSTTMRTLTRLCLDAFHSSDDSSTSGLHHSSEYKDIDMVTRPMVHWNDGSNHHIENESTALVHGRGCVDLRTIVRLLDPKLKTLGERGIECIFVRYVEPSKAFGFYVIELNDLDLNGTEDIGGLVDDPKTFDEAIKSQDEAFWKEAINEEIDSIMGNNTWVLADLPLGCKWIFKGKLKVEGIIEKFKARLVIQGFRQNLIIHQMDVKTAFLNGKLEEEAYMNQPQGFIMPANENKVDLTKEFLSLRFSMKDMGEANVILGIRIKHKGNRIEISQSHYIEKVVSQLKYSRLIGCLMYDMTCTRPDIAFAMGKLRRYTSNHGTQHCKQIQRNNLPTIVDSKEYR